MIDRYLPLLVGYSYLPSDCQRRYSGRHDRWRSRSHPGLDNVGMLINKFEYTSSVTSAWILYLADQLGRFPVKLRLPSPQHPRLCQWKSLRIPVHRRVHGSTAGKPDDLCRQLTFGHLQWRVPVIGVPPRLKGLGAVFCGIFGRVIIINELCKIL